MSKTDSGVGACMLVNGLVMRQIVGVENVPSACLCGETSSVSAPWWTRREWLGYFADEEMATRIPVPSMRGRFGLEDIAWSRHKLQLVEPIPAKTRHRIRRLFVPWKRSVRRLDRLDRW